MSTNDKVIPMNIATDADLATKWSLVKRRYISRRRRKNYVQFVPPMIHLHTNATAECWRRKREELELGWRTEIDDRRK